MKIRVSYFLVFVLIITIAIGGDGVCLADNAASIALYISYPSGKGYVSFYNGAVTELDESKKDHYINVHVTLLDANGLPATAGPEGEDLSSVTATLTTSLGIAGSIVADSFLSDSATLHFDEQTGVGPTARAFVRYHCTSSCSVGNDTIMLEVGDLSKSASVAVKAPDASDIKVRLCGAAGCGIGVLFDADPGQKKNGGSAATAGNSIPFEVLAFEQNNEFTFAPNLEGKEVTVSAYADYDADGTIEGSISYEANPIATGTATFSNGKATASIAITKGGTLDMDAGEYLRVVFTAKTGVTNASGAIIETTQVSSSSNVGSVVNTDTDYVLMESGEKNKLIIGRDPFNNGNLIEEIDYWYVLDDETQYGGPRTNDMAVFVADSNGNPVTGETITVTSAISSSLLAVGVTDETSGWNITKSVRSNDSNDGLAVGGNNVRNEDVPLGGGPIGDTITLDAAGLTADDATVYLVRTDLRPYDPAHPNTGANYLGLHLDTDYASTDLTAGETVTVYITDVTGSGGNPTTQDIVEVNDEVTVYAHELAGAYPGTALLVSGSTQAYTDAITTGYKHTVASSDVGSKGEITIPIKIWGPCTLAATDEDLAVSIAVLKKGIGHFKAGSYLWQTPPADYYGALAPQYDIANRKITDLEPAGQTDVKITELASGVRAQNDNLNVDPIVITSRFVVGINSFLTPDSVNTSDDYGNIYDDAPVYGVGQTIGTAGTDTTRWCTLTFDEDDIGQTGTVTVTVGGASQVFTIQDVASVTSLVLSKEGPAFSVVDSEAIVKLTANATTTSSRQVLITIDASNSVSGAELRDLYGTIRSTSWSQTLKAGSPDDKWIRFVVSAPVAGNVVVKAQDTTLSPLDTASLTITFGSQSSDPPTARISPADGSTVAAAAEIVITVMDDLAVDLGDTTFSVEKDESDIKGTLECVAAGEETTEGTITCSKSGGGLTPGEYLVSVTPEDTTGQAGAEVTSAFTVASCTPVVTVSPASADILTGETKQFNATTECDGAGITPDSYTWQVSGTAGGSINSAGLYTAEGTAGTDTIKAVDGINKAEGTAQVVVRTCVPQVTISPGSPGPVDIGDTVQFTAATSCNGDTLTGNYIWEVDSVIGSVVDAEGLYTAGDAAGTDTVTVTDIANGNVSDSAMVVVENPMTVSPDSLLRSRWILLPALMVLQSDTADFVRFGADRSLVSYSPANAVIPMPRVIVGPHTIWQLVFVNPPWLAGGATDGELAVTVTTGTETVTGDTNIKMLPLGLDK